MKIQPRTIKHEKFKELVKEWLDTHREEYCAFANEVSKRDRSGFQQIFQYAQFAAPTFADAVMARMIIRFAIKRSIKIEHRTKEDWENFRKSQKSMGCLVQITDDAIEEFMVEDSKTAPQIIADVESSKQTTQPKKRERKKVRASLDSLLPNDTERMKDRIYESIKMRSGENDLAMLYIFLHE